MAFSSDQACALADITYRQLDTWVRNEVVIPIDGIATPGCGAQRRYNIDEMFVLAVVADLVKIGMSLDAARRLAGWMRLVGIATTGRVFVDGDGWVLNEPPSACFIVDLDAVRTAFDERASVVSAA